MAKIWHKRKRKILDETFAKYKKDAGEFGLKRKVAQFIIEVGRYLSTYINL